MIMGSSSSGEVGIEHSHHRIADLLRELSSPHLFAWHCLSPIAGIAGFRAPTSESHQSA